MLSIFAEGLDHPEGVATASDGTLYAGGEAGQLYRITAGEPPEEVANTGGFLLGLATDAADHVYACDLRRGEVVRIDTSWGGVEVVASGLVTPNWPVFGPDGALYVTDSGHWNQDDGCIYRIDVDAGTKDVWCTSASNFPNGACLTADRDALYVLESLTPALVRVPLDDPDGRTVVAELPGSVPDGVTIDADGTAYVCCYRPDAILRVADGKTETLAEDPQGTILSAPTNGCWLDGDLIVGNLGRWHLTRVALGVTGVDPLRP